MVNPIRHVDPGGLEIPLHPRLLQREEGGLGAIEKDLLVEVGILRLKRGQVLGHGGTHLRHGGVGRPPVGCLDRVAEAHPPIELEQREEDEEEDEEPAAAAPEQEEGQQEAAPAKPAATVSAAVATTPAKTSPAAAKTLAAAGAGENQQRAHQQHGEREQCRERESAFQAHDAGAGVPPPVSDWPQLVQNFALAAFWVPHFGQATVAPAGAGAGDSAWPQLLQNFAFSAFSA